MVGIVLPVSHPAHPGHWSAAQTSAGTTQWSQSCPRFISLWFELGGGDT